MKTYEKMYEPFEKMTVDKKLAYLYKQIMSLKEAVYNKDDSALVQSETLENQ